MDSLDEFISAIQKLPIRVGSIVPDQCSFIQDFLREHPEVKNILETGFHVGLSAAVMMDVRSDIIVTSFDIFWFDYTRRAKLLLDIYFPGRNSLLAGNSINSIPTFFKLHPTYQPEFIFIDGGHEHPVPLLDLYLILKHVNAGTWIMIDDYCEAHGSGGVIEAVDYFLKAKTIESVTFHKSNDRGWVFGRRSSVPLPQNEFAENPEEIMKQLKDIESHYP